jgi:NADPH:quinone reductase-like Zn-dependent oxidoreductase
LSVGVKVFGSIPVGQHVKHGMGALAEHIVVEHDAVAKVPENAGMEMKEVAGLGIAGATALALMNAADVKEGEKVLVVGAGGGIGHLVLQMCYEKVGENGRVVAITSSRHESWLRQLVKRPNEQTERLQIIMRDEVDVAEYLKDNFAEEQFDLVLDASGIQRLYHSSPSFLKPTGTYASVGPRASGYTYLSMLGTIGSMASNFLWPRVLGGTPRRYVQVTGLSNLESLEQLAKGVGEGKLKVHFGGLFEWEEVLAVRIPCSRVPGRY